MEQKRWKKTDEGLLEEWADHGRLYRWMHDRSRMKYWKRNIAFQIPVIILSTITGAANFAQDRVSEEYRGYYALVVGFTNIVAGVIATIATFLKVSELLEGHRVASIAWGKYYHNVKTELQKEPDDRENVVDFMKYAKLEYEKLVEQSPPIPHSIIMRIRNKLEHGEVVMHLPPIIGAFDKFKVGVQTIMEKEKSGVDHVLNVLGDEKLDMVSTQMRPRSSSIISRASSFAPTKDAEDFVGKFGSFSDNITKGLEQMEEEGKDLSNEVKKILDEADEFEKKD